MEMHKLAGKISAAAAARKFLLFLHFVCKYHLNAISELFLQLRRERKGLRRGWEKQFCKQQTS